MVDPGSPGLDNNYNHRNGHHRNTPAHSNKSTPSKSPKHKQQVSEATPHQYDQGMSLFRKSSHDVIFNLPVLDK